MKKITALLLAAFMSVSFFTSCNGKNQEEDSSSKAQTPDGKPSIDQIKSICNMATLECYYHNVAESEKLADTGITHIGEKDRKFWIEYTGVAKLGIDMTKVKMDINKQKITITLPKAKILGEPEIEETTLDDKSYISSEDGWNSNEITAEDQTNAIQNAQENMETTVKANESLLLSAQNRAKSLISNYIEQIGNLMGTHYETEWEYLNES